MRLYFAIESVADINPVIMPYFKVIPIDRRFNNLYGFMV